MSKKLLLLIVISSLAISISANDYQIIKRRVDTPIHNSLQYFLVDSTGKEISTWADIDINFNHDTLTGIVEIPKESAAKLQMIKTIPNHPLMQDTRTNKNVGKTELRHYAIPLPMINYGFIPMTWEQPLYEDENGFYGDNDPIDFVDLSEKERKILDIVNLKVLGAFCLIDQGELDWKVFTIDAEEARQKKINSHQDIPQKRLQEIIEWFKIYKTYDGKPANTIGFGEKIFTKEETLEIIFQTHVEFMKLKRGRGTEYAVRKEQFHL